MNDLLSDEQIKAEFRALMEHAGDISYMSWSLSKLTQLRASVLARLAAMPCRIGTDWPQSFRVLFGMWYQPSWWRWLLRIFRSSRSDDDASNLNTVDRSER